MTEFERFFETEWWHLLDTVKGRPGEKLFTGNTKIEDASWDRRAAYLIWKDRRPRTVQDDINDLI